MEINWGTAIIGLISILVCIIPFALFYFKSAKRETEMLQVLKMQAAEYDCEIRAHEFCGDFVLGIDDNAKYAFFYKQNEKKSISQFVDLSKIQTCRAVIKTRKLVDEAGTSEIIERIELSFIPKNKSEEEIHFEMYHDLINVELRGELQFVERWSVKINDCLISMQ